MTARRPPPWLVGAGPWLAIGTSPAGLGLGAALATRHGGSLPAPVMAVGVAVMASVLLAAGRPGVRPGRAGWHFSDVVGSLLEPATIRWVHAVVAVCMAGWFTYNVAVGGTALARVLGTPPAVGVAVVGGAACAMVSRELDGWRHVALVTTGTSVVLVAALGAQLGGVGVTARGGAPGAADLLAFVGYVATFALRSADFTTGFRGRADLAIAASVLVAATALTVAVGAAIPRTTDGADLGALSDARPVAGAFVGVATFAPALVAAYSGRRSLQAAGADPRTVAIVAAAAVAVATTRPDRLLLDALAVIGAGLLPLLVVLVLADRTASDRRLSTSAWLPGATVAAATAQVAPIAGAVAGTALAAALTARQLRRASPPRR